MEQIGRHVSRKSSFYFSCEGWGTGKETVGFPVVLKNGMGAATVTVYSANRIQLDKGRPIRKKKLKVGIALTGGAHPFVFAEYFFFLFFYKI